MIQKQLLWLGPTLIDDTIELSHDSCFPALHGELLPSDGLTRITESLYPLYYRYLSLFIYYLFLYIFIYNLFIYIYNIVCICDIYLYIRIYVCVLYFIYIYRYCVSFLLIKASLRCFFKNILARSHAIVMHQSQRLRASKPCCL